MTAGAWHRMPPRRRAARWAVVLGLVTALATAGGLAGAYVTLSASGSAQVQVAALRSPGPGQVGTAGATSLPLAWSAAPGLPPGGGYAVYRATSAGGPWAAVAGGGCAEAATEASPTPSCTDTGLDPGSTYWYEVFAAYPGATPPWLSAAPDVPFAGTTADQPTTTAVSATTPSSAPAGTLFTAAATVAGADAHGTPTGTVTFSLYSGAGCGGPAVVSGGAVPLAGGAATGTIVPKAAGTYSWGAAFSPAVPYDLASAGCAAITVTVTAAP